MKEDLKREEVRFEHTERLIVLLLRIAGPVVLTITGLVLLYLRLAGWSLIFGLPTTIIGVVLLIYSYDEIISRKLNHVHGVDKSDDEEIDY